MNNTSLTIEEISTELLNEEKKENNLEISFNGLSIADIEEEKYSDYVYEIENEGCNNCNVDTFTIIKEVPEMFFKFINTESKYSFSLFNFFNKVKNF